MIQTKHKDYLLYEIPSGWIVDEANDSVSIYDNDGKGALTLSFLTIIQLQDTLDEYISVMAKKFIDNNQIRIENSLILDGTKKNKLMLHGIGTTDDGWFIKLWVVAKYPRVVFATYQSERKTSELKKVDAILESFQFTI